MECRGAGGPPARWLQSGKQAKKPMFSIISRTLCALPLGECGILPRPCEWKAEGK